MSDTKPTADRTVTVTELAYCSGSSRAAIRKLLDHDLLTPVQSAPEMRFDVVAVERVRKIRRIEIELEVEYPAMALVLDLLDRIESLERQIQGRG